MRRLVHSAVMPALRITERYNVYHDADYRAVREALRVRLREAQSAMGDRPHAGEAPSVS